MSPPAPERPATESRCDVVVFDYDGVCTPTAQEYIDSDTPLATLRPGVAPVVDELRCRGVATVLLSNEFDRRWIDDIDGFPKFDEVLVGSDNRIFKPDRRAFQRALLVTGCEASRCLVVDDDDTNVTVARSIGCASIRFDPDDPDASWRSILDAVG